MIKKTYLRAQIYSDDLQALFEAADRQNDLLAQVRQVVMANNLGRHVLLLKVHHHHVSKLFALCRVA